MRRISSVSLAAYDGISLDLAMDSLAGLGVVWVEPAFIVGYTEAFDQTAFGAAEARRWRAAMAERHLGCYAISAHIDLGLPDAVGIFRPRMDFARSLGARIINTNASLASRETQFRRNIETLARHADAIGLMIGLENPGNGEENLFNRAADGVALVQNLGLPALGLNFDAANLASHRPDADTTEDALLALPHCVHFHIKDVARRADGWHFTPIGRGNINSETILRAIRERPELPISLELPLRLRRGRDAQPLRAPAPLPLSAIEAAIAESLGYIRAFLSEA